MIQNLKLETRINVSIAKKLHLRIALFFLKYQYVHTEKISINCQFTNSLENMTSVLFLGIPDEIKYCVHYAIISICASHNA